MRVHLRRSWTSRDRFERSRPAAADGRPLDDGNRRRDRYLIALMRSSAPFGQSLPYLSTYFFCAKVRNAFGSGS